MTVDPPTFTDRAGYDAWWRANGIAHNRLAATDPDEWERITREIERRLGHINRQERAAP